MGDWNMGEAKGKKVLEGLKYTENHEWIKTEGDTAFCGISDFAQDSLGDIVFMEYTEDMEGEELAKGDVIAVVESSKAASDVYTPVSGEILDVNSDVEDSPETLNSDPYGEGWLVKIKLASPEELNALLSADDYEKLINSGE